MLTQKTFFEFISATMRVFSGKTKEEVKEQLIARIKWQREQLKAFELDLFRYDAEIQRRKKEIDQCHADMLVYESELEKHFGDVK